MLKTRVKEGGVPCRSLSFHISYTFDPHRHNHTCHTHQRTNLHLELARLHAAGFMAVQCMHVCTMHACLYNTYMSVYPPIWQLMNILLDFPLARGELFHLLLQVLNVLHRMLFNKSHCNVLHRMVLNKSHSNVLHRFSIC